MEVCDVGDDQSTMGHSGNVWDTILTMTQKRSKSKRKSLTPPSQDTPHVWQDYVKHAALCNLLDGAIDHKDIELRTAYIQRIMKLEPDIQRCLMTLIESRKTKSLKTPRKSAKKKPKHTPSDRSPFTPLMNSARKARNSPALRISSVEPAPRRRFDEAFGPETPFSPDSRLPSPKRIPVQSNGKLFSPGLGDSDEYEKQFQLLKEKNADLMRELAKKEAREDDLIKEMEHAAANHKKDMMKLEAAVQRKEDERVDQHDVQITELKEELSTLQAQYEDAAKAKEELAGLKDEIELMQHTKNQLADTSERLQTYKEKLQQLTDVKEALTREETAHSKSVEECLRLENELKSLYPLKRQLEEYKNRCVESEVRLVDCQDELSKLRDQRFRSSETVTGIETTMLSQMEEISELRNRVQQDTTRGGEASGVGDGLSELNPELKEEMFRLRNENIRLREFQAKREDDAVTKLEQDLEDSTLLGDRYKSQYLSTKNALESTQRNLEASRERESKLRNDVAEAMEKNKATQEMVKEASQELFEANEQLTASRDKESKLEGEMTTWIEEAKSLQEKANELSNELQERNHELESAKGRELQLYKDVDAWKAEHSSVKESAKELAEKLRSCEKSLQISQGHEIDLREQVDQLTIKAASFENEAQNLLADLDECTTQLQASIASEKILKSQLEEKTKALGTAEMDLGSIRAQLSEKSDELESTTNSLAACIDREESLCVELEELKTRIEDSETVSKQRMELVQSTRDKLKTAKSEITELEEKSTDLSEKLAAWKKKTESLDAKADHLQISLSETIQKLNASNQKLDEKDSDLTSLENCVDNQKAQLRELRSRSEESESLTESLQDELVQMRQLLNETQTNLQGTKSNESFLEDSVLQAKQIIFSLEESLEVQSSERDELEVELESKNKEVMQLSKEIENLNSNLTSDLQQETEKCNKYKQDLFNCQEELNATQSSLGAAQHREKMLKLEVSKLADKEAELERDLEKANKAVENAVDDSEKSLRATREVLSAKGNKEIKEIQANMNRLLEDERRAKRESNESYQQKMKQMRQEFDTQLSELKDSAHQSTEVFKKQGDEQLETVKKEYEARIEELRKHSEEESSKLVAKGKGMLKDVRNRAKEEYDSLHAQMVSIEEMLENETSEKERIVSQAKAKILDQKKKLKFASSRMNSLSAENDELEEKLKTLERERFKLAEENDRYVRQIGGRGGPDSKLQGQLDLLQKEFKSAMEETKELRRKLKEKEGYATSVSVNDQPSSNTRSYSRYSRNAVSKSTLVQLRTEYEETIEALNDEKRELVMKNSAAITDVQKAETRVWETEQENAALKQQLTSMQLRIERLHTSESSDLEPQRDALSMALRSDSRLSGQLPTLHEEEHGENPDDEVDANSSIDHSVNVSMESSPQNEGAPSFVDMYGTTPGKDAPPECTQS